MTENPNYHNGSAEAGYRIGQNIALASVAISAALAALKIGAGFALGSTALLADGFESASDIFASLIVLGGMILARRPADSKHAYGYGRAESLAGQTVATILLMFAVYIGAKSVVTLFSDKAAPPVTALLPLGVSFAAKGALSVYKRRVGLRLNSSALLADAANDAMDMLSAIVAAAAIGLAVWQPDRLAWADPVGGIGIAGIIFWIGLKVFRQTSSELLDAMPDEHVTDIVRQAAGRVEGVRAVEKVLGRKSGMQYFFDLHIEVDPQMTVQDGHHLGHLVEERIIAECQNVKSVLVHVEPFGQVRRHPAG
ncbi:MAG: cation diffusion facilitator family transporter [Candidatus Sumerlaeaceae bacterium]|nr:cation diffusion facilitator family transporter [Candidatus Sumerlaeaceae bacterium]